MGRETGNTCRLEKKTLFLLQKGTLKGGEGNETHLHDCEKREGERNTESLSTPSSWEDRRWTSENGVGKNMKDSGRG